MGQEFKVVYVVHQGSWTGGQEELDKLLAQGWQVFNHDEESDSWVTNDGVHCYKEKYQLTRNT